MLNAIEHVHGGTPAREKNKIACISPPIRLDSLEWYNRPMDKEQRWLLISDSHVGDRVKRLQAKLLDDIKAKKPDLILHGGDIAVQEVLDELSEIAPVIAVQGNRDW